MVANLTMRRGMANASSLDEATARKLAEAIGALVSPQKQPVPVGYPHERFR